MFGDYWYRIPENSWNGTKDLEEFLDVYGVESSEQLTEEQMSDLFKAMEAQREVGMTDEMLEFMRDVNKKGNSKSFNWVSALSEGTILENPSVIFEAAYSSLLGMAFGLANSSEARKTTAKTTAVSTGIGIGLGASWGALGGPLAPATSTVGAFAFGVRGFFTGLFGGINKSIETGMTFGEQLRKEVEAAGLEWSEENVKKILKSTEKDENGLTPFERIKNKSLVKGNTVMAIDMIANAIAPGAGGFVTRQTGKRTLGAVTALSLEGGGGALGEYQSSKAIGEKASIKELQLEFFGEFGASGPVSVLGAIKNPPSYKINNKKASAKDVKKLLNDTKITDQEFVNTSVDIKNNTQLYEEYNNRLSKIAIKAQIDPRVNQESDINKIIDLEQKLQKITGDTQSAKGQRSELVAEIKNITDKYKPGAENFVDARTANVKARKKASGEVKEAIADKVFSANLNFAKKHSALYGLEVDDSMSVADIESKYGKQAAASDGFIEGNKIIINKTVAKNTGAVNVANHELLHGILRKSIKENPDQFKNIREDLKKQVGNQWQFVENRALAKDEDGNRLYSDEYLAQNPDEWITLTSDAIANGQITYNESIFQPLKDFFLPILRAAGFKKIKFNTGKDVFEFLKEYNRSIHKGTLSSGIVKATKGKVDVEGKKFSRGKLIDDINDLQQGTTTKADFQKPEVFNPVFESLKTGGAVNNYIRSLQMSPEKTQETIDAVTDRLINFDPAAKRKDGSVIGPKGLGEFIMANVGFGKKVAAKKLAVKAEKAKKTTTIDTKEAKELEDVPTSIVEETAKGPRVLDDFNLNLEDGLVDSEILAEVESLLNENPTNLKEKLNVVVKKHLVKNLKEKAGKIQKIKGKVVISPEYETFIRNNFNTIKTSLDIQTIRKLPWFDKQRVGTEDVKGVSKITGKTTNFRKGIFINKANKPKYLKYYTQGGFTTLRERQSALLSRIVDRKVDAAVDKYIEQNSTNVDAVTLAKLNSLTRSLELAENELKTFDTVKYAMSKKTAGEIKQTYEGIKSKTEKKGKIYVGYTNPFTGEPQTFTDLGKMWEQAFANYFYKMNIDGLEILSQVATEEGGMADFVFKYFGKEEQHEIKAGLMGVFMGSTLFNSYNHATGKITLANDVHNNLLTPEIKREIKKAHKKRVDQWNTEIKKLNKETKENNLKRPIYKEINYDIVPGSPQFVPYEIYHNKGLGVKSLVAVESNEKPIENHYTSKGVNSISILNTPLGNVSFSLGDSMLRLARLKMKSLIDFTYRNPGSQKKTIDGYEVKMQVVRIGIQFKAQKILNKKSELKDMTNEETFKNDILPVKASKSIGKVKTIDKAVKASRTVSDPKGITVLDFDDTLATTKSLVRYTAPDGTTGTLNAEEFANSYQDLLDKNYKFDFSEFNKVVKGKIAPLFQKALKLQGKFGPENMFVLTARPPQAQKAIFDFLKANGLNIPIKNITGLGNSTAEAKALWIADKVGEGFNDFYFADDALQNVQAVDNMLEQFDVKRKVQQAKVKFSKSMNDQFNNILEDVTGIESVKRFDFIKARKRGAGKGKFRFFIPPSHEDFVGLLYNFMGKGKKGNAHRDFLEQALVRPLNRANKEYDTARQSVATDYKNLNKQTPDVKKMLTKKTPDGDFTYQDAIRIYLWDKHGYDIPGLSPIDQKNLVDLVKSDSALQSYAETINTISRQDKYVNPTDGWDSGDIRMDLDDATGRIGRSQFFEEFNENAGVIFSTENLNKIEAGFGKGVRSALEDMLYRVKTGRNKPTGQNKMVNSLMNWVNGSVGSVMFFNMRSALLQQMSLVNYINFADNNIFAAAKAFANQKQYWTDWAFIFNSDMLKQRRGGIMTDVNGAELAAEMRKSKSPHRFLISKLLELGFLPTQIGDNIAIATGGATYYRNRINTYLKQGLTKKEAEAKAFTDFQDITQSTQQSARPDMVSQQQASIIGKVILNFQNVTSQFNRLGKKAFLDIKNRRITKPNSTQMQSDISNAARITYYFAVQNAIFYTLQTALFAMMFDDDEEDNNNLFLKKKERLINGSIDSVLRGTGITGAVISTLKNVAIAWARQRDVNYNPDESAVLVEALNFSPVIGIKARKIANAEKTLNYNKKVIKEMETFDIDNPQWSAVTNYIEAGTNLPLNRLYNKTQNVRQGFNNEHAAWERTLMFLGWSQYNLNLENEKMDKIKESTKNKKTRKTRSSTRKTRK